MTVRSVPPDVKDVDKLKMDHFYFGFMLLLSENFEFLYSFSGLGILIVGLILGLMAFSMEICLAKIGK